MLKETSCNFIDMRRADEVFAALAQRKPSMRHMNRSKLLDADQATWAALRRESQPIILGHGIEKFTWWDRHGSHIEDWFTSFMWLWILLFLPTAWVGKNFNQHAQLLALLTQAAIAALWGAWWTRHTPIGPKGQIESLCLLDLQRRALMSVWREQGDKPGEQVLRVPFRALAVRIWRTEACDKFSGSLNVGLIQHPQIGPPPHDSPEWNVQWCGQHLRDAEDYQLASWPGLIEQARCLARTLGIDCIDEV